MEQSYMEILLEEMRGKFDLVLEGHDALRAEMREYHRQSNERHDFTAFQITALKDRIDTVELNLSARIDTFGQNLSTRIDTFERNLTAHIEAVAVDLAAHRADTEAHVGYRVRE